MQLHGRPGIYIATIVVYVTLLAACREAASIQPTPAPEATSTFLLTPDMPPVSLTPETPFVSPLSTLISHSPLHTPTMVPTPTATRRPTRTPTSTPTPIPTPPPLPESDYLAMWAELYGGVMGPCTGSALWLADPGHMDQKSEVLRFEREVIYEAVLSPDRQRVALATVCWPGGSLWTANADGTGLQKVDLGERFILGVLGLLWSRDSRSLLYHASWRVDGWIEDRQGTPIPWHWAEGATYLLDVETWDQKEISGHGPDEGRLYFLGWSADGEELYYARFFYQDHERQYEVWSLNVETMDARRLVPSTGEPNLAEISPDGSKFLYAEFSPEEHWYWVSAGDPISHTLALPDAWHRCGFAWTANKDELAYCELEELEAGWVSHIKVAHLHTKEEQVLATFDFHPGLISLSPDREWMLASVDHQGKYWVHLSTGSIIPVQREGIGFRFTAWVPRERQ